ncbi:hypothetical protein N7499_006286 [Penicillium canescens]|nr:hypothetical protein N7499_006286 [Penicillium canescens]KAJ6176791.1 hypothetical protein N7485_003705 [Penicillium canescens]
MQDQIPLIGNYTHVHRGVQPNVDAVKTDIFNGILAQEANSQAKIPGTAVVISGGITLNVASNGATRKVIVTGFDILSWTERRWHEWNCKRHWDVTAVVSYYGAVQVYPEGETRSFYEPEPVTMKDLEDALRSAKVQLQV